MDLYFGVTLIKVEENQTATAKKSLKGNCIFVKNGYWIFEGGLWVLEEGGVKFKSIAKGAVPALGDMGEKELVELCNDVFGINIDGSKTCFDCDQEIDKETTKEHPDTEICADCIEYE